MMIRDIVSVGTRGLSSAPLDANNKSIQVVTAHAIPQLDRLLLCVVVIIALFGFVGGLVSARISSRRVPTLPVITKRQITSSLIPASLVVYDSFTTSPVLSSDCPIFEHMDLHQVSVCSPGVFPVGSPQRNAVQYGIDPLGFIHVLSAPVQGADDELSLILREANPRTTFSDTENSSKPRMSPIRESSFDTSPSIYYTPTLYEKSVCMVPDTISGGTLANAVTISDNTTTRLEDLQTAEQANFQAGQSSKHVDKQALQGTSTKPIPESESNADSKLEHVKKPQRIPLPRTPKTPSKVRPKYPPRLPRPMPAPALSTVRRSPESDIKVIKKPIPRSVSLQQIRKVSPFRRPNIQLLPAPDIRKKGKIKSSPAPTYWIAPSGYDSFYKIFYLAFYHKTQDIFYYYIGK